MQDVLVIQLSWTVRLVAIRNLCRSHSHCLASLHHMLTYKHTLFNGHFLEWWGTGVVCSKVPMICIRSSWCHCHSIISCFIKIQNGLSFWCRLTQVVLERRPLNVFSSSSSSWQPRLASSPFPPSVVFSSCSVKSRSHSLPRPDRVRITSKKWYPRSRRR